ncbi:MAG: response regulator [Chloroflexi bacterium]|nr:response regulator [Chloroflexota bacterium]
MTDSAGAISPVSGSSGKRILIVEDDLDLADMLNAYFRVQGYEVLTANWGEDAITAAHDSQPDLVVLDIRLPDIDGYEVARRLRAHRRTERLPIIFLTERRDRTDKLKGLEIGVVDYITKPFDIQELRLRVRNVLSRASLETLVNPVTGLPEGELVDERLSRCLKDVGWGLLRVGIHGLDTFRESYGFVASDDVLRAISLMLNNAVREAGNEDDLVGHLAPDDFIIVTSQAQVREVRERVEARLSQSLDYFYPLKDRDHIPEDQRLAVTLLTVTSGEGPFDNLEALKSFICR